MNHIANQLVVKILSVQKFSVLVLRFEDFLKNTFKWCFTHFLKIWGHDTHIKQYSST